MKTRSQLTSRIVLTALGVVGFSGVALADHPWSRGHRHNDHARSEHARYERNDYRRVEYADVVDVDPIVRRVRVSVPQRECWNEERPVYSGRAARTEARSTLIGGLIGAAVGSHIARVHGDVPAPVAVVGASMIGAAIGNDIGARKAERRGEYREVGYENVQRCDVDYRDEWEERIDGYNVTYVYHGREYTTRMDYDPGRRIRVNVDVFPDSYDRGDRDRY